MHDDFELACPVDKTPLRRASEAYRCDSCDARFPVERGVVRFLPGADEFYEGRHLYTIRFVPRRESPLWAWPLWLINSGYVWAATALGAGGGDRDRDGLRWRRRVLRPPLPRDRTRPLGPVARRDREPVRGVSPGGRRARDPAAGCQRRRGARLLRLGAFHAGSEAAGARGVRASASPRRQARLPVRPRLPEPAVSDPEAARSPALSRADDRLGRALRVADVGGEPGDLRGAAGSASASITARRSSSSRRHVRQDPALGRRSATSGCARLALPLRSCVSRLQRGNPAVRREPWGACCRRAGLGSR